MIYMSVISSALFPSLFYIKITSTASLLFVGLSLLSKLGCCGREEDGFLLVLLERSPGHNLKGIAHHEVLLRGCLEEGHVVVGLGPRFCLRLSDLR